MKKIISLLLCAVMLLGLLAGCGNQEEADPLAGVFSVGYGCVDVTPTESVPLGGYNNSADRYSTGTGYPFHAITIAFTDEDGKTVLFIALDMLLAYGYVDSLRDVLVNRTGLPKSHILIHTTHNHSGPDMIFQDPAITSYSALLAKGVIASAEAALADRKPAQMYTTFTRPQGFNFVRHYLLADGNYQAEGVGAVSKDQLIGHATQADNLLQLVKFTREGGKDVVLINWQGHPRGTDPSTIATSNYPGVMRDYINKNMDCQSIFILSGSGNINNNSQISSEVIHKDYIELGTALGEEAVKAAANFTPAATGKLLLTENLFTLPANSGQRTVPLYALSIGDFAMVTAPFEIFDTNAVAVRETSDFKMTFYASCSNESHGYLPTPMSFDWKIAYEVRITNFPMGTAEIIQGELTTMLADLFTQSGNTKSEKPEGYIHTEFVPATDGKTYIVPSPGQTDAYKAVENDFYAFTLLCDGKLKNMLAKDEELVKKILAQPSVQLIFDVQHVVVGIVE